MRRRRRWPARRLAEGLQASGRGLGATARGREHGRGRRRGGRSRPSRSPQGWAPARRPQHPPGRRPLGSPGTAAWKRGDASRLPGRARASHARRGQASATSQARRDDSGWGC